MRPYKNIKLDDDGEVYETRVEGRKSSARNRPGKGGDIRSFCTPHSKASSRRYLKRSDRAKDLHFEVNADES